MLPGIGFQEFLLLMAAALIFVGPKDLPLLMRKVGTFVGKGQALARDFRAAFDDIARQAELDEMRKEIESLKKNNTFTSAAEEFAAAEREINAAVMRAAPAGSGEHMQALTPTSQTDAAPVSDAPKPNEPKQ